MGKFSVDNEVFSIKEAEGCTNFEVIGAGGLRISNNNKCLCGNEHGFRFEVSWGLHGYAGGVLSNNEAKKLARHIIEGMSPNKEPVEET